MSLGSLAKAKGQMFFQIGFCGQLVRPPFLPLPTLNSGAPSYSVFFFFLLSSIMQSWYFIFLWGGCRGQARKSATVAAGSLPNVPLVGFSDYGKNKQHPASQPFSVLGLWGNSLSCFWLPLWDAGWSYPGLWRGWAEWWKWGRRQDGGWRDCLVAKGEWAGVAWENRGRHGS